SAITVIDYPERFYRDADDAAKERVRQGTRERLHKHWDIFADQFTQQPFLTGAAPGGLDFLAVVVSKWSGARAHLKQARPQLFATLQRIEQQPVVAAAFARHWPG